MSREFEKLNKKALNLSKGGITFRMKKNSVHCDVAQRGGHDTMLCTYTAKYTKIKSGYMGQLVEWPEIITEGKNLDECRELLRDALEEMVKAYKQQKRELPVGLAIIEQIPVEV
jgi:predicted RNase H-like HicB family nuclease